MARLGEIVSCVILYMMNILGTCSTFNYVYSQWRIQAFLSGAADPIGSELTFDAATFQGKCMPKQKNWLLLGVEPPISTNDAGCVMKCYSLYNSLCTVKPVISDHPFYHSRPVVSELGFKIKENLCWCIQLVVLSEVVSHDRYNCKSK